MWKHERNYLSHVTVPQNITRNYVVRFCGQKSDKYIQRTKRKKMLSTKTPIFCRIVLQKQGHDNSVRQDAQSSLLVSRATLQRQSGRNQDRGRRLRRLSAAPAQMRAAVNASTHFGFCVL